MKILVNTNKVEIMEASSVESGEYNVTPCIFEMSEEYKDLINVAVFTAKGHAYKENINRNRCEIPSEVLVDGNTSIELGVYGYAMENNALLLRYSPKPCQLYVEKGSYKEASNSTPPTPTQFEQYEAALAEGLAEVQNVDIDASKSGTVATVTITNRNGTEKTVTISDGAEGQRGPQGVPRTSWKRWQKRRRRKGWNKRQRRRGWKRRTRWIHSSKRNRLLDSI